VSGTESCVLDEAEASALRKSRLEQWNERQRKPDKKKRLVQWSAGGKQQSMLTRASAVGKTMLWLSRIPAQTPTSRLILPMYTEKENQANVQQ